MDFSNLMPKNIFTVLCLFFCFLLFLKEGTQKSFCWPCQKSLAPMSLKILATPIIIIFINMTLVQLDIRIVRFHANLDLGGPFIVQTRVSIQGVKSLCGHFACLCQGFDFYEVKKEIKKYF